MSKNVLLVGDPHANPGYDNDRFELIAKTAHHYKVDELICIGDWADMPSLSSYDKGRRSFEGRRYHRDVEACHDALKVFDKTLHELNSKARKDKKKRFKPKKIMVLGNHEVRINTATQLSPELEGTISIDDLEYEKHGWEQIPFGQVCVRDGIAYSHYHASGVMGRPIGGENIGVSLIRKCLMSAVTGHNHLYDHAVRTKADGSRVHGLSIGCFVHPAFTEAWCANSRHLWWQGLVLLKDVKEGDYTLEALSYEELLRKF